MNCATYGSPEPCVHPLPLILAMAQNKAGREKAGLSTTDLLACQRFGILSKEYDYYEAPEDFEARFKGTALHAGVEALLKTPGVITEKRYYRELDGVMISGKMDVILPEYQGPNGVGKIVDVKSGGRRHIGPDMNITEDHIKQVNMYRWILAKGMEEDLVDGGDGALTRRVVNIPVNTLSIMYVGDVSLAEVECPVWDIDQTEDMIREMIRYRFGQKLPPILPSRFVKRRATGTVEEERHWMCQKCPLRDVCDSFPREGIRYEETGTQ